MYLTFKNLSDVDLWFSGRFEQSRTNLELFFLNQTGYLTIEITEVFKEKLVYIRKQVQANL